MPTLSLPTAEHHYYDSQQRYTLHTRLIFVFGSNEAGRHGRGAALEAIKYHGAIYGQGHGLMGHAYGIPTKDRYLRTLPLEIIKDHIEQFVMLTQHTDTHYFYITPIGTGLAGYRHAEIAPLFKGVQRSWLPDCWQPYLDW